ncbi:MAG: bifunctional diaminohydroxyphosphoribosylaminopyrimidine deaminase/5-amino-6-(5-phosphoribosylamino)uracil reductase RibD [Gammaproteobacteria bacterium]|nr:bifunctional diaminohydroxyphosphoribosylaminopyrimidine deaminase/5-amino-6-(5-phosphoribosylamino)uracil reductase RibD [Gammaproteobacteria bacterium]
MGRALELAAQGRTSTQPNPRVGCVIAFGEQVIGEGWHQRSGEPHAEVFALREAGERARGATAFVTLEPCNHHGRTPPCSVALIAAGIARVIYASGDPNPRVDGSGAARLREAGVVVEQGLRAAEGEELNLGFFSRMRRQRPWLRLKMAASLDGRTATASGESHWITSDAAREDVQRWRAESAAILSTSATVLADDPRLSVRLDSARQPLRVLLDRDGRIPKRARLFAEPGEVLHLTSKEIALEASGRLSLPAVLSTLNALEINEVWTEAGATLAGSLITANLVDELVIYLAPMLLGSEGRPLAALKIDRLLDASRWQTTDLRQIGPDIRIMLRPLRSA